MIEIKLKIKEEKNVKFKSIQASDLIVELEEMHIKPTTGEIKGRNFLIKKLGFENNVQVVNESSNKKLDDLIKELFSL